MGRRLDEVKQHRAAIYDAARRHRAVAVSVFGSTARGDDTPSSDVDFLVEFEPGGSLLDLVALQQELADVVGCPVDVFSAGGLKDRDDHIRAEAVGL